MHQIPKGSNAPSRLAEEGRSDEALLALEEARTHRSLDVPELVLRGRCIQLASEGNALDLSDAEASFLEALTKDPVNVPALLELGWFYFAVEDDATRALPFFEKAALLSRQHLTEAEDGVAQCLEEVQSLDSPNSVDR